MRKNISKYILAVSLIISFLFSFVCFSRCEDAAKDKAQSEFIVYYDKDFIDNHYFASEMIGDSGAIEFDDGWKENPQSGNTCIQIKYNATGYFGGAGLYWVNPAGNWGQQKGGYDLRFAKELTFWVRGEKGGEHIAVFKFGGLKGLCPDSDSYGIGPIVLTDNWQKLSVNLKGIDMSRISAGFSFEISKAYNRKGCIFYIDNVKYE
ncbi:MAG: hypothetical protein KJ915_08915 [Candidatus Omnitrophica bacterium]|nr:hypothetical protein [Candidatus Omnitrophota bacterium]